MKSPCPHITKWNDLALPIYRFNCTPNAIGQNAHIWSAICFYMVSDEFLFSNRTGLQLHSPKGNVREGAPGSSLGPLPFTDTCYYCSGAKGPNLTTQNNEMYENTFLSMIDYAMIRLPKWYDFSFHCMEGFSIMNKSNSIPMLFVLKMEKSACLK